MTIGIPVSVTLVIFTKSLTAEAFAVTLKIVGVQTAQLHLEEQ